MAAWLHHLAGSNTKAIQTGTSNALTDLRVNTLGLLLGGIERNIQLGVFDRRSRRRFGLRRNLGEVKCKLVILLITRRAFRLLFDCIVHADRF